MPVLPRTIKVALLPAIMQVSVQAQEPTKAWVDRLEQFDINQDGLLNVKEIIYGMNQQIEDAADEQQKVHLFRLLEKKTPTLHRLFPKADGDGNGQLDEEEFSEYEKLLANTTEEEGRVYSPEEMHDKWDLDVDGKLSLAETIAGHKKDLKKANKEEAAELKMKTETARMKMQKSFDEADKNDDGELVQSEWVPMARELDKSQGPQRAQQKRPLMTWAGGLQHFDEDGDGVLSRNEMVTPFTRTREQVEEDQAAQSAEYFKDVQRVITTSFVRADANKDRTLDVEEFQHLKEMLHEDHEDFVKKHREEAAGSKQSEQSEQKNVPMPSRRPSVNDEL